MDNKTRIMLLDEISYLKQQVRHITDRVTQLEKKVETEESNPTKKDETTCTFKAKVSDVLKVGNTIIFCIDCTDTKKNTYRIYVRLGEFVGLSPYYLQQHYYPIPIDNFITDAETIGECVESHNWEMYKRMEDMEDAGEVLSDFISIRCDINDTELRNELYLLVHNDVFIRQHIY